jgi:predicted MFS family arabinose efflux permease
MMLSSNISTVLVVVSPVLLVDGLERRTVLLVTCIIFMVGVVLRFACDQVVLLRIVLSYHIRF